MKNQNNQRKHSYTFLTVCTIGTIVSMTAYILLNMNRRKNMEKDARLSRVNELLDEAEILMKKSKCR